MSAPASEQVGKHAATPVRNSMDGGQEASAIEGKLVAIMYALSNNKNKNISINIIKAKL